MIALFPSLRAMPRPAVRRGRPRVAIIGAGPGGLAVALLLARAGVETVLFEKDGVVGGRTRTLEAAGGYRFDLGPTFFLYPEILREVFAACGEDLADHVELRRLDPLYRLIFEGDASLDIAADPDRLASEIATLAPADARNLHAFLAHNRRKLEAFRPILQRAFDRAADLMAPAFLKALPYLRPTTSVDRELQHYFADPRIRLAFSFQTKYLGMSPFRCPSLFTILSYLEHGHGVYHPIGGCGAVSTAMARLAERLGVTFEMNRSVERIEFEGGRARQVVVGGRALPVDAVVVNADFAHAIRGLVPEAQRRHWRDRRLASARLSCSTFMLYLGIEGEIGPLGHHTVLLARDYHRNIREIEAGILPEAPSVYVQHAGATDPTMAPPGHTSLYVLAPVPNLRAPIDWSAVAGPYRRIVLDRLKLLGLPDLEDRIRFERMVTPQDWQDAFAVGEGATFNLAHDLRQMLYFRPHNRFAPGVYLVGGGTHPGSGLPVIFEGARITARLLLEDLGVPASDDAKLPEPGQIADAGMVGVA